MATVIYNQPERYGLAYNDNPYVIRSLAYTPTQRFKISVVTPSLQEVSTQLIYPRRGVSLQGVPNDDRAYFDPSRILQSQLGSCIAIPEANHAGYFDCPNMAFDYALSIREQDKVNGVYIDGDLTFTDVKTVWNGGVNTVDWLDFDYTDYDIDTGSGNKFLTNAPNVQYIDSNQSAFLYLLGSNTSSLKSVRIEGFDSNGSSLGVAQLNYTANNNFNYIPVGTYDINNADPSNWSQDPANVISGAAYYEVTEAGSEKITFKINQRCSKYEPIRLHWLNRLGGYDSFNFSLKSMEETDIDRRSYHQQHHIFTGLKWDYTKDSRGVTDYHVGTQRKLTVNTTFLTEEESIWMEDFATSPIVYQEVNNELIAMSGMPKAIDKQTSLNDKLMQYTFELDYSLNDMRQRG